MVPAAALPWLTVEQMAEADRLAVEDFGIDLLQMMEHAGAALAEVTDRLAPPGRVVVLAGAGNNGGGGLCAARHLVNRGRDVSVVLASERPGAAAAHHLVTLRAMGVEIAEEPGEAPVVVDAMVGYGLSGPLRGRASELAQAVSGRFTVALDFPSGHGHVGGISAAATLTLALPKIGLRDLRPIYLADLGLPPSLWARMGLSVSPLFGSSRILEITA
jgi:NAD(P)H-hydrate epimerase